MEKIINKMERLETKDDFVALVALLIRDLKDNPEEWINRDLESYLDAIVRWTQHIDRYYQNNNLPAPSGTDRKTFANILIAAKMYK